MRTKDQFAQALRSSIEAGYPLVLNVMTCCNGCTTDADVAKAYDKQAKEFDLPALTFAQEAPNAVWHFGGQGNQIVFDYSSEVAEVIEDDECYCYKQEDDYEEDEEGNEILLREGDFIECGICKDGPKKAPLDDLLFNHTSNEAAEASLKVLREAGFDTEWDGSTATCITVH